MGNFKDKLARFMYGRYGIEQMYVAKEIGFKLPFELVIVVDEVYQNSASTL